MYLVYNYSKYLKIYQLKDLRMPIYNNTTPAAQGNEYLKIPPHTEDFKSIYFYNIKNIDMIDTDPYYNPVLYKNIINFSSINNYQIELTDNMIGQHQFLFIQVNSKKSNSLTDVEIIFNDINNLPSLPISNSVFSINNNHRIKRIFINTKNCSGEIIILVTDKFIPSFSAMSYDYKP
jgi:hypothetical protein